MMHIDEQTEYIMQDHLDDISLFDLLKRNILRRVKYLRIKPRLGEIVLIYGDINGNRIIQPGIVTKVFSYNLVDVTIICNRNWPTSVAKMTRMSKDRDFGWDYLRWYKRWLI